MTTLKTATTPGRNISLKADSKKETIEKPKPAKYTLTDDEKATYGDRFPKEYIKLDFLGRGGFALVWLGACKSTGRKVAVKQIVKSALNDSSKKELYYGQLLFEEGGRPRPEFLAYEGNPSELLF